MLLGAESRCMDLEVTFLPFAFEFEDPDEPKLQALRDQCQLDERIVGVRMEFDQIVAIGNWVADIIRSTAGKPPAPHEPKAPPFDAFYCLSLASHYRLFALTPPSSPSGWT